MYSTWKFVLTAPRAQALLVSEFHIHIGLILWKFEGFFFFQMSAVKFKAVVFYLPDT